MDEDLFSRNAQGIGKIYQEVLLLMKFQQTKPQVKIWLLNVVICILLWLKKEKKRGLVHDDEYEKDYNNFNDFIIPNHYIGRKNDNVILR